MYGKLEVITGAMFSNKSGELIRRLMIANDYEKKRVVAFSPKKDTRTECITSRNKSTFNTIHVDDYVSIDVIEQILTLTKGFDVVGFDETQFFKGMILYLIRTLVMSDKRVIVSGLNMNHLGLPFGKMGDIMAIADEIDILYPVCLHCREDKAIYSHRLDKNNDSEILVGSDEYIPVCRKCYKELNGIK